MSATPQTETGLRAQLRIARLHLMRRRAHIVRIARILCVRPAASLADQADEVLDELWHAAVAFGDGPLIVRLCLEFRRRAEALR